jgi:hypothetical protein
LNASRLAAAAWLVLWGAACGEGVPAPDAGPAKASDGGLTITYAASNDSDLGATATIAAGAANSTAQAPDAGDPWYGDMQTASYSAQNGGSGASASAQLSYTLQGTTLTFTATTTASASAPFADGTAAAKLSGTLTVQAAGLTQVKLQTSCSGSVSADSAGTAEVDLSGDHGPYNVPLDDYCQSSCTVGTCSQWTAAGEPDGPTAPVTIPAVDGVVTEGLTMYIGCLAGTYDAGAPSSCAASGTFTLAITPGY